MEVILGKEHVWVGAPQHCLAFTEPAWLQFVFLCTSRLFLLSFFPPSMSLPLPLFLPSLLSFLTFLTSLPPSFLLLWFILELHKNVIERTKNLFFMWNKNNVFLQVFVGISIAWHTLCHKSVFFHPTNDLHIFPMYFSTTGVCWEPSNLQTQAVKPSRSF